MSSNDEIMVWTDIETNGLRPETSVILEVGFMVTTLDLKVIDSAKSVIQYSKNELKDIIDSSDDFVQNMHRNNGLWADCEGKTSNIREVQDELIEWARAGGYDGNALCGSSLAMDRAFLQFHMPSLHSLFHYRSIDNSTVKELCRRYNPDVYKRLPESETDHRVFTCLEGSISEFEFYLENFIWDARDDD